MATFDTLIDDLATQFGLGANARTLVREVLAMISSSPGGFGGFLDKFKSAGLTSEVASWLGRPDASPIAAGEVERALGANYTQRHCRAARSSAGRCVDRARIRLAEDRRPLDAGRRRSGWDPSGGHGFSLAASSCSGHGASRAEADRRSSGERGDRIRHPALAMAGARRVGRRCAAFLFLVDAQPDAVRAARRKGAGAGDTRAGDRRAGADPAACSFARASPAAPTGGATRCARFDGNPGDASSIAACSLNESGSDASTTAACSLDRRAGDRSAGCASAGGASARRTDSAPGDRTGACDTGPSDSRSG